MNEVENTLIRKSNYAVRVSATCLSLVAAGALVGGCSAKTTPAGQPAGSAAASKAAGSAAPSSTLPGGKSACGLTDVKMDGTLAEAPTAEWLPVGKTKAPKVEGQGPGLIAQDGWRSCYARTPTGAVLYVANIMALASDPAVFNKHTGSNMTPGDDVPEGMAMNTAGFKFDSYNGSVAKLHYAFKATVPQLPEGILMTIPVTLKWTNGDWNADDATSKEESIKLENLDGYVPFAAA